MTRARSRNKRCCTEKKEEISLIAHGVGHSLFCIMPFIVVIIVSNN